MLGKFGNKCFPAEQFRTINLALFSLEPYSEYLESLDLILKHVYSNHSNALEASLRADSAYALLS